MHDVAGAHQAQQDTEESFAQQASAAGEMHVKDGSAAESKSDRLSDGTEINDELTPIAAPIRRIAFGISREPREGRNMPHLNGGGKMYTDELDHTSDPARHA
jgi:hypothetical protein